MPASLWSTPPRRAARLTSGVCGGQACGVSTEGFIDKAEFAAALVALSPGFLRTKTLSPGPPRGRTPPSADGHRKLPSPPRARSGGDKLQLLQEMGLADAEESGRCAPARVPRRAH